MQELTGAWLGWAWFPQTITQKNSKKNFITKLLKVTTLQQPRGQPYPVDQWKRAGPAPWRNLIKSTLSAVAFDYKAEKL